MCCSVSFTFNYKVCCLKYRDMSRKEGEQIEFSIVAVLFSPCNLTATLHRLRWNEDLLHWHTFSLLTIVLRNLVFSVNTIT